MVKFSDHRMKKYASIFIMWVVIFEMIKYFRVIFFNLSQYRSLNNRRSRNIYCHRIIAVSQTSITRTLDTAKNEDIKTSNTLVLMITCYSSIVSLLLLLVAKTKNKPAVLTSSTPDAQPSQDTRQENE